MCVRKQGLFHETKKRLAKRKSCLERDLVRPKVVQAGTGLFQDGAIERGCGSYPVRRNPDPTGVNVFSRVTAANNRPRKGSEVWSRKVSSNCRAAFSSSTCFTSVTPKFKCA